MNKFIKSIPTAIATGFGLGYMPIASGTWGALLGCLLVWGMVDLPLWAQIVICAAMTLACIPVCTYAESALGGEKDNGQIVADEYLTFPICMLGLHEVWPYVWWFMPVCFIVNRIMDIIKPFPAYRLQALKSGLGITIDDFFASIYALAINWGIYLIFIR